MGIITIIIDRVNKIKPTGQYMVYDNSQHELCLFTVLTFCFLLFLVIFIHMSLISPTRQFTNWGQSLCWFFFFFNIQEHLGRHLAPRYSMFVHGLRWYVQCQESSANYTISKLAENVFICFQWSEIFWFTPQKSLQKQRHISKARKCYVSPKCSKLKLSSLK